MLAAGARDGRFISSGRPTQKAVADNEVGRIAVQNERTVGQCVEQHVVTPLRAGARLDPLGVQPRVDRVGAEIVTGGL